LLHYCFVGERRDVLGVWVAGDEISAARLQLHLELSYPDCETIVHRSSSFESLKESLSDWCFGDLEPDHATV